MTALYAGAAVRRITPDLDAGAVYLAGFQADRPATGVNDYLHVRAMALRPGESGDTSPFLLAVCDLIGLGDKEVGCLLPSHAFVFPRVPFRPGDHYEETMSVSRYATPLLAEAWLALLADLDRAEGP